MAHGLYGKLPAKRDFIAVNLPQGFLTRWEPWLQGNLSAAMLAFGARWKETFFLAPLWRFWIGKDVLGIPIMGVLMPSMDGVGRQFPLTLLSPAPDGQIYPSLLSEPQVDWFDEAENLLLSTLDDGVPFEGTLAALEALTLPVSTLIPDLPEGVKISGAVTIAVGNAERAHDAPLQALHAAFLAKRPDHQSIWWTIGGENFPPLAFSVDGLPDAALFQRMMAAAAPAKSATQPAPAELTPEV